MSEQSNNPLAKYFRQPAIHLTLPSKGQYWPMGTLDLNMSGQIEVYPMTTKDEITVRTPDALLNGQSIVSVIQSCCPQIKDAWKAPSIDIDALLIGIRIASYGQNMDIDTICPNQECKHENKHSMDLSILLDSLRAPNYNKTVDIDNVKIKLKPIDFYEQNKTKMLQFEQERALSVINNEQLTDEEKTKEFNIHFNKLIELNFELLTSSIEYIETQDGIKVSNIDHIKEFFNNCSGNIVKKVRERFDEYIQITELPKPRMACEECNTEYPVSIGFDYTSFFANAS